jgi:poly(3-hydroxybutyrate) depolymerase
VVPVTLLAQLARLQMGNRARVIPRLAMGGDADQGIPPACVNKALDQGLRTNNLVLGSSQTSPISLTASSTREIAPAASGHYPSTVSTYLDPAGCLIGERWLIHGMNHFWPGGTTDSKYKSFTDPKGPNGAEVIWSFFERFTKSGPSKPCA